jgi:formylglycine-generating enzyme required for sulfatase activity
VTPCSDCANLAQPDGGPTLRVQRGGAFLSTAAEVLTSVRGYTPELSGYAVTGFRCARTP